MIYFFSLFILLIALRTLAWHLQTWQLREYRFDRMRSHLRTKDGQKNLRNFWFFKGLFPRPTLSLRILIIVFCVFVLSALDFFWQWKIPGIFWFIKDYTNNSPYAIPLSLFIWERLIFIYVIVAVWISKFPVWIQEKRLYKHVKKIIQNSNKKIVRIAITGSYGKSSTKEILIHILTTHFGKKAVFFNPENQNNEIAIARRIKQFSGFFLKKSSKRKFSVIEIGAYKRGEIAKFCQFYKPHISILTAVGTQHIDLFGNQKNIQLGKFELAEHTSQKSFFNADSLLLQEIFEDKNISATPIAISTNAVQDISAKENSTEFTLYGKKMILPWPGEFFISNALLTIECARELGVPKEKIPGILAALPPLKRALSVEKHTKKSYTIFKDLYSANVKGVLSAIDHLKKIPGKKYFFCIPLLELGKKSQESHEQIFYSLKEANAEVFWLKSDHKALGKKILGKKFHSLSPESKTDIETLQSLQKKLTKKDGILFESRIPENILRIFE